MRPKAVILDFDGVVVDTERARFAWLAGYLQARGVALPASAFSWCIGRKTEHIIAHYLPDTTKREQARAAQERREAIAPASLTLIKGLPELLAFLEEEGIPCAITTGTVRKVVIRTIRTHRLRHLGVLTTGEEFSSSKPDPECYRMTLRKLGLSGKETIVVEDAPAGVQAAKGAGCKTIGLLTYTSTGRLREAGADWRCKDHTGVVRLLKKML
jgi:HAD superfamily hydrolase (TIGR01509 family)